MGTNLRIFQLNVLKRDVVQLSVMKVRDFQDYAVLAVAESYALNVDGAVVSTPNNHRNWIKIIPTKRHEMQYPVRSIIWIRSDLEAEQVPIPSANLTGRYFDGPTGRYWWSQSTWKEDEQALCAAMIQLQATIAGFRNSAGKRTDIVLAGDFNRHD
ncbi:hypothetical protein FOQG_17244 [Fusarium oxysporum f. sp. raphani 54005]|uniref:Endonuclease/exonuclease/phosphatase domain-containing protein n=1 Tax=Fusarium oxysporum f. sp. raphani 54005 TaxID=1089458 RepID=X0BGT4_FUSOX|nr:hypothetical protein FOQG_17244 [Fusarium oxysporum f. sp. raphani 54005]